jgi:hypothetical protein
METDFCLTVVTFLPCLCERSAVKCDALRRYEIDVMMLAFIEEQHNDPELVDAVFALMAAIAPLATSSRLVDRLLSLLAPRTDASLWPHFGRAFGAVQRMLTTAERIPDSFRLGSKKESSFADSPENASALS